MSIADSKEMNCSLSGEKKEKRRN